ncbi:hypothetical protein NL470_21395, partial [Klebsiella pneumoniae]|nr:hypothetical protein [Klebsiella pneumoniae]
MVCVVGRMRDLILQLSKSSIYSTKPPEGRGLIRHLKQQHYLAAQACLYYPVYPCFSLRAA